MILNCDYFPLLGILLVPMSILQLHRRPPPAKPFGRQAEPGHARQPAQDGMHAFPQLAGAFAVDDPDLQDAPLPALVQIGRYQIARLLRLEQVQVERAVDGPLQGRWRLAGRVI